MSVLLEMGKQNHSKISHLTKLEIPPCPFETVLTFRYCQRGKNDEIIHTRTPRDVQNLHQFKRD